MTKSKRKMVVAHSQLTKRFEGANGQRLLREAVKEQKIVSHNDDLATSIISAAALIGVSTGTVLIDQGGEDNDVYLIIAGAFRIEVNGKLVAERFPSDHVGEMAAIQPSQSRSASVIAAEDSVVLKLTESQFAVLGERYPGVYRYIAKELARRLRERNRLLSAKREKSRIFIISSAEALPIARTVQSALEYDAVDVFIWPDGVFRASQYTIESLERELDQSDFAIAIAQPDDLVSSRGKRKSSARDNVIFELGMFIGRIGRHRSILLEPRGSNVALPSDLSGLTTIPYRPATGIGLASALGPACTKIRTLVDELGPIS